VGSGVNTMNLVFQFLIRLIFFISGIKMHSSVVSCLGVDITLLLLEPMPTSSGDVVAVTSDLYLW
jgi:hypothetical protein